MSNGIDKNPLLDISKVYLEQIVEKKDDSYLEPDMKKRQANNEKARKEMEKVKGQKNPHFEEKKQEWDSEIVNSLADVYKEMQQDTVDEEKKKLPYVKMYRKAGNLGRDGSPEAMERSKKITGVMNKNAERVAAHREKDDAAKDAKDARRAAEKARQAKGLRKEALDPVGQEDGDIDNDGDKDKSDKYLAKRRKAISNAIKGKMKKEETDVDKYIETVAKVKEAERKNDVQRWFQKESHSSNWRQDLSEIMTDDIDSKPIKEKNVKNKIKINPKLGEAIEEIGGTILEEIEVDEIDVIVESVYSELIEEGFAEDEVEFGIETALNTFDEGYYDSAVSASEKNKSNTSDTPKPKMSIKDRIKSAAKKVISGTARAAGGAMKAKASTVAAPGKAKKKVMSYVDRAKQIAKKSYQQGRGPVEKKTTYRGAGAGRKEKIGEAVYGGTPAKKEEPKDNRMTVTNADKKANTPAYQAYKAGNKKYKSADHMNEGDGDPCWDSHKQVGMKKKGGKMVPNCVPKNEEVDHVDEKFSMAADPEKRALPRPTGKAENKKGVSAKSRTMKAVGTQRRQDKETGISGEKNPRAYREENDVKEDASMSPQEIALQKKKAMLDRMIAQKRQQGLNKVKKSEAPVKAMGEGTECAHSIKGKDCPVHGKKDCPSMDESTEDSLRDRRMERGGVDGNNRYNSATKNVAMGGGKKKPYDGMSALEKVKANIRAKHGQGAIIDTKKK